MSKPLLIFQSMWAMEGIHPHGHTASVEDNLQQLAAAGFDGFTDHYYRRAHVQRLATSARELGLQAEGQVFPTDIDGLQPCGVVGVLAVGLRWEVLGCSGRK